MEDIEIVAEALNDSLPALGVALGFSEDQLQSVYQLSDSREAKSLLLEQCRNQSSSFLELLTNLERIGRADISDNLIDCRMKTSGLAL